ncbi:synaptotagmin-17 isoform X2 [Neopsephotus bourkii]|uniref:synaptotagmin-17 isoform X2 n=1 Tax=Neopsephotus bourkii TaxID=309878 RepID=UPI002AA5DB44|nr:synaptotagmin-17 isoform X2 [Neopsephotus bourkii]
MLGLGISLLGKESRGSLVGKDWKEKVMAGGEISPSSNIYELEPINEGLLARISDLLLCRWTCRNCCQKCFDCSCCQTNEDEVEILGPFPAQTPAWLISSQNEDKDGDSDNTISELPPTLQDVSPDRRRSSSDTSRSTYSLTRRISSLESRRPSSPLIDIKPIEFGIIGAKKEVVQPTILRKTYTPDDYFRKFEPRLYSLDSNSDDMDSLTDEEILSKYQLGMLHFSTQYDLLHNYLIVRVIEAKDLPPPISYDGSRQDMAHSNPYVKICLLPDQKNSKQTGVKRKTQNPVFEERYTFEIPFLEAQRRTLLLTVVDFDKFSRHCVIGKVSMPLSDVDLVKGGHWWKALVPSSQLIQTLVRQDHLCLCVPSSEPALPPFLPKVSLKAAAVFSSAVCFTGIQDKFIQKSAFLMFIKGRRKRQNAIWMGRPNLTRLLHLSACYRVEKLNLSRKVLCTLVSTVPCFGLFILPRSSTLAGRLQLQREQQCFY